MFLGLGWGRADGSMVSRFMALGFRVDDFRVYGFGFMISGFRIDIFSFMLLGLMCVWF